ncbi:phosphoribosyltransferase [soil metagenome]
MTDLYVTWDEYHEMIEDLAVRVLESDWEFDQLLCLARGGLRIGDVFSRIFPKPLAILTTSSYRENAGTEQSTLIISENFTSTHPELGKRVLLIDDMADSGKTIVQVIDALKMKYPHIEEIRTAVLWHKGRSIYTPDYAVQVLPTNPWIHQPFELYDNMKTETLVRRAVHRREGAR